MTIREHFQDEDKWFFNYYYFNLLNPFFRLKLIATAHVIRGANILHNKVSYEVSEQLEQKQK